MKSVNYLILLMPFIAYAAEPDFAVQRGAMVAELRELGQLTGDARTGFSEAVLAALDSVPRHALIPDSQQRYAYENRPLPIGYGQTISQPYIVALMTELVKPDANDVVLEVGTGSGYQAAVLAELVSHVYSIEIVEALAERARAELQALGYANVTSKLGDGYYGWAEHGPFDGIVVTAAASHVPPPLIEQLRAGGRMVIPVGSSFMTQTLLLIEKTAEGEVMTRQIAAVRFVPLTGGH